MRALAVVLCVGVLSCGRTQVFAPSATGTPLQPFDAATDGGWRVDSRLVLWLEADTGFSPDHWVDQSPAKNDAHQPLAGRQPGLDGGRVRFEGNQFMRVEDATTLHWSGGDWLVFVVMEQTMPMYGWAIVYGKWNDASALVTGPMLWASYPYTPWDGPAFNGYVARIDITREALSKTAYNDGALRLVAMTYRGGTFELRINGQVVGSNAHASGFDATAFDAAGQPALIGGREDMAFQALQGGIAEMMAFKGSLSDAELASVEQYLMNRYGL